jgi:hypothetical protein
LRDNNSTGITVATCAQLCVERQRERETASTHAWMGWVASVCPDTPTPRLSSALELVVLRAVPLWREQQQSRRLRFACVCGVRACITRLIV